jgi:methionyl-tRNA formyltransferase
MQTIVPYIYSMDLYLSGTKGLAALEAFLPYCQNISSVRILPDAGVLNDPYEIMLKLVAENKVNLVERDSPISNNEALAVGWKFLIKARYDRIFVVHDSLLPKYRGWNPLVTALQNKDSEIGVTLLIADEQIDHGPIVLQSTINVSYPLKIADAMKAIEVEIKGLVEFLLKRSDRTTFLVQNQVEELATYSIWRNEEDYRIDWTKTAENISTFIDSVSFPYKGASTTLDGQVLRILSAKVAPDILVVNRTPGKVWKIENQNPTILCGSGSIEILEYFFEGEPSESRFLTSVKSKFV